MKVVFVNSIEFTRDSRDLPLGIMSLATICNLEDDIEAKIVDFGCLFSCGKLSKLPNLDENLNMMCKYLLDFEPDVVSFYSLCSSYHLNVMLSKRLKEKKSNIIILFGGPHASLTAEDSLRAFPWVDYIGVDEGEHTIVPLLRGAVAGQIDNLNGVAFRKKDSNCEIVVRHAPMCDVDLLPMIDYSIDGIKLSTSAPIDVGRGCPFGCVYCSTKTFWKQSFRLKSVERIVSEICYLKQQFGIENFALVHDLFTVNKHTIFEFCNALIEKKMNITWSCSARLDTLSFDLLDAMYDAGCRKIYLGIETGSDKMQKIINKNLNLDLISELVVYIQKYNIEFTCSFIYGFPEETPDDLNSTLHVIKTIWEAGVQTIQLHKATFLPGTAMYEKYGDNLLYNKLCTDFTEQSYLDSEANELISTNKSIFPQFYTMQSVATQYPYLDIFVLYLYPTINSYMPFTTATLSKMLGDGILPLYISFQNVIPDIFETITSNGGIFIEDLYKTGEIFGIIKSYLQRFLLPTHTVPYEIASFEIDAVNFLRGDSDSITKHYSYDVLSLLAGGNISSDIKNQDTRVVFVKSENETVTVRYADNKG